MRDSSIPVCPYCDRDALQVGGETIYPQRRDLWAKVFWLCQVCRAYVGCHPASARPLGRLANAELRKAKMAAHAAFDPAWRTGKMKRRTAYRRLSESLGIDENECHIGMFDVDMCKRVVAEVRKWECR